MKRFLTSSPQSKIPGALGAIFGSSFLLEKVPISLKGGSPFWNVLTQPSPYLADPLPNAPTVVTLKFTKGAECRTPRSRMQNQGPNAEHHVANFLGVMLILRSIFWPLKRKLMEFSCHIQLSSVPPRCVMLWRSPEMNFIRHPRVTKLFCIGPPLNRGQGRTYCSQFRPNSLIKKNPIFSVQWISTDKGNYFTFCQLECFQSQCCTLVGASLKNRRKNFENLKNLNFEKTLKTTVALWRISQKLMQNESKFLFNNNHR